MMTKKIIRIKALPRFDGVEGFQFWCPWCNRWHYHGKDKGHRLPHCTMFEETPYDNVGGYILVPLTLEEKKRLKEVL